MYTILSTIVQVPPSAVPCGLVVRIRRSHRRGRGSIPRMGRISFIYTFVFFNSTTYIPLWPHYCSRSQLGAYECHFTMLISSCGLVACSTNVGVRLGNKAKTKQITLLPLSQCDTADFEQEVCIVEMRDSQLHSSVCWAAGRHAALATWLPQR